MRRRNPTCDFCVLSTPTIYQRRDKRVGRMVALCARHRDTTEKLNARQRGIVGAHMRRIAAGERA